MSSDPTPFYVKSEDGIPGWNNGKAFYDMLIATLPPQSKVLEMGVFFGRGMIYLAEHSEFEVYAVDQFDLDVMCYRSDAIQTNADMYGAVLKNVFDRNLQRRITLIALSSERASKLFADQSLDCVFIDGAHGYEDVIRDISYWRSKVKPGGFISGDDYAEPWGVIKAVDELFPERLLMENGTWYQKL